MNYLAHIFLSGNDASCQIGNFIGDAVKGDAYRNYPHGIVQGILLHRAIDFFTDNHPVVRQQVHLLRERFGRYAPILLDIYLDYLLASRFDDFSPMPLKRFARHFYYHLLRQRRHLPPRIKRFMWHFIATDRLNRYATPAGIEESLRIMVRYKHVELSPEEATAYLVRHEEELWNRFRPFFGELQAFCRERIRTCAESGHTATTL